MGLSARRRLVPTPRPGPRPRGTPTAAAAATIAHRPVEAGRDADVVLRVRRPSADDLNGLKPNAAVVSVMDPYGHEDAIRSLAEKGAAAFAMEFMPRITRAQVMDVLSSQANIAGYRAVVDAPSE